MRFNQRLVLNQWMLSLFGIETLDDLGEFLRREGQEGLDENNIHRFHHALVSQLFNLTSLTDDTLLEYDQNIVRHTQRLNERRLAHGEEPVRWKHFQYLSLLFTEIYLDRYFSNPVEFRREINAYIAKFNEGKHDDDQISPFDEAGEASTQLNKLAFWSATGSGKTLLMHANILQYRHYLERSGNGRDLNRIILLTPNEGLSEQHLREFETAGIDAERFSKDGRGLFVGQSVEVIEVTKLREEMGDKTVAYEAFEGNNLVLVDEGHRGVSSGEEGAWMKARNALCERGFSFEYSATFGQAVKASPSLANQYAKSVLIDYSYRYFYNDGFGKDYQILNLDEATQQAHLDLYLVACLITFYQQMRLFHDLGRELAPFAIEKPLWVFVGGSVTKGLSKGEATDIVKVLQFIQRYVSDKQASVQMIDRLKREGLRTAGGRDLFAGRFGYLVKTGQSAEVIFDDSLKVLFNASTAGTLYIENLKGAAGEIALRIGPDNEPFGVINVGEDAKLTSLCADNGLETGEREFAGSLFHKLAESDSTVNLLIGSKKFTEGWSSWRVSTMGLLNVGKSEGAQIIQLFGRGVRLKGYRHGLKRSKEADIPPDLERPRFLSDLETLNIFGIQANYMAQFREFLEDEGVRTSDDREEMFLPVIRNLGELKLKTIRLKQVIEGEPTEFGRAFRRLAPIPTLGAPPPYLQDHPVVVNWYPKIAAMKAKGLLGGDSETALNEEKLSRRHVAFLDTDWIYLELERFKAERGWFNFNLSRDAIEILLGDPSWYRLYIPTEELAYTAFERTGPWQEIALALLKQYAERYYLYSKKAWEMPHLEYRILDEADPNFTGVAEASDATAFYRVLVDKERTDLIEHLKLLKSAIEKRELTDMQFSGVKAVGFSQHLYEPLLYVEKNAIEVSPTPLNKGEIQFVEDLKQYCKNQSEALAGKQLYLLRNLSRGKGVGFFEEGGFYPDFIVWLVEHDRQKVTFVDPKGIRNLPPTDRKIRFHKTIKDIQEKLGDPSIELNSFIIANTPVHTVAAQWSMNPEHIRALNIAFQVEDKDTYISRVVG